jgi:hypothetical protein
MNQIDGFPADHRKLVAGLEARPDKVIAEGLKVEVRFDPENKGEPYADVIVTRHYRLHDEEAKAIIKDAL